MSANSSVDTSVVIPVFCNVETLPELYRRLTAIFQSYGGEYELIFVDDASPDTSLEYLRKLATEDRRVVVVALAYNVGQHRAVWLGVQMARGNTVAIMDADLQDAPEALPSLLAILKNAGAEKPTAVFAGRRGIYQSWPRMLTSRLFKLFLCLFFDLPADAGLFCVLNQEAARCLARWNLRHPFLQIMLASAGVRCVSIPVRRQPRAQGVSSYSFWRRLLLGLRAVELAVRLKLGWEPPGGVPWPIRECIGGSLYNGRRAWEGERDAR